jgi:hypothetical protein
MLSHIKLAPTPKGKFLWNGTILENYSIYACNNPSDIQNWNKDNIWCIKIEDTYTLCYINVLKTTFPIIIDELKPFFGLPKLGTHIINYNNKKLLLVYANTIDEDNLINEPIARLEPRLNQLNRLVSESPHWKNWKNEYFCRMMQLWLIYREFLGVKITTDACFALRWTSNNSYWPVSFTESSLFLSTKRTITNAMENKWFTNVDKYELAKKFLKVTNFFELKYRLLRLENYIEQTISRIDKRHIIYKNNIINRIKHFFTNDKDMIYKNIVCNIEHIKGSDLWNKDQEEIEEPLKKFSLKKNIHNTECKKKAIPLFYKIEYQHITIVCIKEEPIFERPKYKLDENFLKMWTEFNIEKVKYANSSEPDNTLTNRKIEKYSVL